MQYDPRALGNCFKIVCYQMHGGLRRALTCTADLLPIPGKSSYSHVHLRIVWQAIGQKYSGANVSDVPEGAVMVVHPRSKSQSSLVEALRLVKTYTGENHVWN